MFWKKMKTTTDAIELMEEADQREAFRYVFKGDRHLSMIFKEKSVQILDISAGGIAFKGEGFRRYDADQISLFLNIPNYRGDATFSARLRILNITDNGICHCIFEKCTIEKYEMIHKYVLEMQKNEIISNSKNQMR